MIAETIITKMEEFMFKEKPIIIFEMANNHMGDIDHGLLMVDTFGKFVKEYPFNFAFKFQFRDIPTFIHPDYQGKMDIKYVKRFTETALTIDQFSMLINKVKSMGMLAITTPFDEPSVDKAIHLDVDILKIGSCSCGDWPLLEKIALVDKPIIFSTAGASFETIDRVVSFFQHREKQFAIMHCVGEYPTIPDRLQINQISLLKNRYPGVPVGFSTHEDPQNYNSVYVAFGKGAQLFEKHVAVETEQYSKNAYSATPNDMKKWLDNALKAYLMLGVENERHPISEKEKADLRQFKRGVFVKSDFNIGHTIKSDELFFAWPSREGQVVANDFSKYKSFILKEAVQKNDPLMFDKIELVDHRANIYNIVQDVKKIIKEAGVIYPGGAELEISHHYGVENFYETGITMITVVNREYCKKLIVILPKQNHPEQYHKQKEETFHVLYGDVQLYLNGTLRELGVGGAVTIEPGVRHSFTTKIGCVIEEISSTHYKDDSYYTDDKITQNKDRKTLLKYWL